MAVLKDEGVVNITSLALYGSNLMTRYKMMHPISSWRWLIWPIHSSSSRATTMRITGAKFTRGRRSLRIFYADHS